MSSRQKPTRKMISCAEFARMAGVSSAAVTQACKPGKTLEAARVGKRLDLNHPSARRYLKAREKAQQQAEEAAKPKPPRKPRGWTAKQQAAKEAAPAPDPEQADELPENIAAFADWTLRQVIDRFGTELAFGDWLRALKAIEDVEEKRLKNMERRGLVVSRGLVETHIFGLIESTNQRLLQDSPKTIAGQVRAAIKTGAGTEELERLVRDIIGGQLKTVKARATRALRDAVKEVAPE